MCLFVYSSNNRQIANGEPKYFYDFEKKKNDRENKIFLLVESNIFMYNYIVIFPKG